MKICIIGAGATGGYLGVKLINAGLDVSLVARGRSSRGNERQRSYFDRK